MSNIKKTKEAFNKKLDELRKDSEPAYQIQNLKEMVIFDKLIDIEEKLEKLSVKLNR